MARIQGGCLCGRVRYRADVEPVFVGVCHCRNCQKATGSAFAAVVGVPEPALAIEGEVKVFRDTGDSGKALLRTFCPDCGSSLFDTAEAMPGLVMVLTGTMDDPSWVKPATQIYCDSAQPWVELGGEMRRFPKMIG